MNQRHATPTRIRLARQRRGLTINSLAQRLEVNAKTVTRWESGYAISPEALERLASELKFPVEFLLAPEVAEVPVEAVSFRALSKTSAGLRRSAIAAGTMATEFSDWIDSRFRLPDPNVPTFPGYDPETASEAVRARWGLSTTPIPHLLDVLEAHGVRVFSLALDVADVDAFSFYRGDVPFVLVNTRKTGERQRFDMAHELGHLVLHCESETVAGREAEHQAQRFAAAFLMPREDVLAQPLWNVDPQRIIRGKARWGVSAMALAHRLRELGMLTEWGYRDACVQLSAAGYRRGEPSGAIVPETSQILRKVVGHLREQGVGLRKIADELRLTEEELNLHVLGLVPLSLDGGGRGGGSQARLRLVNEQPGRNGASS
jgi:Zn-dependent peptidase ImmA (M78 family)/transcriptional regulator with XRE-family HTH domain